MAEKKNPFEKIAAEKKAAVVKEEVSEDTAAVETEEEVDIEDEADEKAVEPEDDSSDVDSEPVKAAAPAKSTRRTAKQVEEEYAARQAALEAEMEALKAQLAGKADIGEDIGVLKDRVVLEDGIGGSVRVIGNGKSLTNDDWRCTADGLRLILGRASSQSTQNFVLPLSLIPSLAELLSQIDEITE